jgi:hypothetical protein
MAAEIASSKLERRATGGRDGIERASLPRLDNPPRTRGRARRGASAAAAGRGGERAGLSGCRLEVGGCVRLDRHPGRPSGSRWRRCAAGLEPLERRCRERRRQLREHDVSEVAAVLQHGPVVNAHAGCGDRAGERGERAPTGLVSIRDDHGRGTPRARARTRRPSRRAGRRRHGRERRARRSRPSRSPARPPRPRRQGGSALTGSSGLTNSGCRPTPAGAATFRSPGRPLVRWPRVERRDGDESAAVGLEPGRASRDVALAADRENPLSRSARPKPQPSPSEQPRVETRGAPREASRPRARARTRAESSSSSLSAAAGDNARGGTGEASGRGAAGGLRGVLVAARDRDVAPRVRRNGYKARAPLGGRGRARARARTATTTGRTRSTM